MACMTRVSYAIKHGLYRQLLSGFGISILTVGITTLGINYQLVRIGLEQQVRTRVKTTAQTLEFATEGLLEAESSPILQRVVQNYATLPTVLEVAIIDPSGITLARGPTTTETSTKYHAIYPDLEKPLEEASITGMSAFVETRLNGKATLAYILPFSSPLFNHQINPQNARRGLAVVKVDFHQIRQDIWPIFLTSTTTMVVGTCAILVVMGSLLKKYVLSPLLRLNETVADSQVDAQFSLPSNLPDNEIKFLANTFEHVFQERQEAERELRNSEAKERENASLLARTLSDLQETQAQLIQTEKMAGLGQLVAGIAHEINNPVGIIHGNLKPIEAYTGDLLRIIALYQHHFPKLPLELEAAIEAVDLEFIQQDLSKINQAMQLGAERIQDIVLSLRNFSRLDESARKRVDLHEGIENTLMLLQHRLKAKPGEPSIQLIKEYGQLPAIECYAAEMNQVFMHLLDNAIDALQKSGNNTPKIKIQTAQQGNRYIIKFSDNGVGIPEENLSQIFNPFFTTKPVGEGRGLGLAVSYRIVEHHRGTLTCTSSLGKGTEFLISLPIAPSPNGASKH